MTPLFSDSAPWSPRLLLVTGLVCLPIAWLLVQETFYQRQVEEHTLQVRQQLDTRKATLKRLQELQQHRLKQAERLKSVPPAVALMDRVASVMQSDVILQAIDIHPAQREVRLNVNASSLDAVLALSERLQKLPARVVLESHRTSGDATPAWPVIASLTVQFLQEPAHDKTHPS
jgi:General secretion pathway protein L (GspL).